MDQYKELLLEWSFKQYRAKKNYDKLVKIIGKEATDHIIKSVADDMIKSFKKYQQTVVEGPYVSRVVIHPMESLIPGLKAMVVEIHISIKTDVETHTEVYRMLRYYKD